ncbi:MAG: BatA domain-containing protein [Candidatus Eisenbacteria sp.]|nr:BatA domain-containing protein [Candidatus Eisenbacteria bacterium]
MGPLTFLNGAFLAALAAAALPILIHLFSRRKARELPFSHVRFLDEITRKKISRMRLRQWLLLVLRTLAVALIALALSQPVWHGPGMNRQRGSSTVAILIDDSFSMEARLDPGSLLPMETAGSGLKFPTRFEEARQRALQILDLLEDGDRAVLVFTAAPLRVPYESTVRDPALLCDELERAQPRATRSDLVGALERIYPMLSSARTLNREIFIISDFQQTQMEEILRSLGAEVQGTAALPGSGAPDSAAQGADQAPHGIPPVIRALVPVPENTRLYLLPVTAPSGPNTAVVWSFFERNPVGPGGRLTVRLHNLGDLPVQEAVLEVLEGDEERLLAEGFVSIDPGGTAQTVISLSQVPPDGLLTVRSAPDLLERDNRFHLSTAAANRFRILLVTGGPLSEPEIREEAAFPILALDPWGGMDLLDAAAGGSGAIAQEQMGSSGWMRERAEGLQLFEVETVPESDLGLSGELSADAVILLNVGRLSEAASQLLERYQAEGGSVLIALGDRVDPRIYNTQILRRLGQVRLENVIGDLAGGAYFSLRPAVTGHDIFEGFPISPGEMLSGARFRKLLEVRLGGSSRVVAEFSGGRPALVEEPGLLLFTSSLDLRWSDFPTSASYLPFLHRALHHLILRGRVGRREPVVGEPLSYPLPADVAGDVFRCQGPDGIEIPVQVTQTERGLLLRTPPVPDPGFYRIVAGDSDRLSRSVAVNVDTRESDLTAMSEDEAGLIFGSEAVLLTPERELSRQVLEARYGFELWRLLITLAFMLLVAESLIARGRSIY